MAVAIQSLGTFQLHFPEEDWTESFNCYEVVRSRLAEAGPYKALHDHCYMRAGFLIPVRAAYDVDGLSLVMKVNRVSDVTVEFTGTTPASVAAAFNDSMPSVVQASVAASGGIFVETVEVGFTADILVTAGDAWTNLGMSSLYYYGSSSYPPLVPNQSVYIFEDPSAEEGWFYKTRYRNRQTAAVSFLSIASVPSVNVVVDLDELIRGEIIVTDPEGKPMENILVMLDVALDPTKPGMLPQQVKRFTNANGYAHFLVRRGVVGTLGIAGTTVYRRIQVPTTGESFDLSDLSLSIDDDAFKVQIPDTRVGERRSM